MEQDATIVAPVTTNNKQKTTKGWKIATIITSIIAVCGIGFGVFGMVQSAQKDGQISDLKVQIKDSDGTITEIETPKVETTTDSGTTVTIEDSLAGYRNQILASSDASKTYSTAFRSSEYLPASSILEITLTDGEITRCDILDSDARDFGDCEVTGIDKKISKIVEFGEGQDHSLFNVGFILEDGTVRYFSLEDALGNVNFDASKILNINGYVTNAVEVNVTDNNTGFGYAQTAFILNDGSYILFDESML